MFKIKKKQRREALRLGEYLISGGAWFWSGYAMFALLFSVFGLDVVPSKVIAYVFGLSINFLLQRFWVFEDSNKQRELPKVTSRYIALAGLNLVIDTLIVWGLYRAGISPYIGQFVSASFFTVWNYVWYKLWVFAKGVPSPKLLASPSLHSPKNVRPKPIKRRTKNGR